MPPPHSSVTFSAFALPKGLQGKSTRFSMTSAITSAYSSMLPMPPMTINRTKRAEATIPTSFSTPTGTDLRMAFPRMSRPHSRSRFPTLQTRWRDFPSVVRERLKTSLRTPYTSDFPTALRSLESQKRKKIKNSRPQARSDGGNYD